MRCKELNVLFIDICKNASKSVCRAFRRKHRGPGNHHSVRNFTAKGYKPKDPENLYRDNWKATCDAVTEEDLNTYRTFSVIRNPYDRLVSLYNWGGRYRKVSFGEFINNIKNKVYNDLNQHHWNTQLEWISDHNDTIRVQKLLRYENLDEDFHNLLEEWNIPQLELKKENAAEDHIGQGKAYDYALSNYGKKRHHYKCYYDRSSKKILEELYAKDIEYFNYKY